MAKISLSPKFIKEVINLFRERPLKEIIFGKKVVPSDKEAELLNWVQQNPEEFKRIGGRKGNFGKVDVVHKGSGTAYCLLNKLGNEAGESIIILDENTQITQGPDLWIYLSSSKDVKKDGLGEHLKLVLIKGNKGGQAYVVNQPIHELNKYKSVVIWCKQFAVLFTFAKLS